MFTGGLKMSRSEAKAIAESNGGKVFGFNIKKFRFFSCWRHQTNKKEKLIKQKELNIKIIPENEWNRILDS